MNIVLSQKAQSYQGAADWIALRDSKGFGGIFEQSVKAFYFLPSPSSSKSIMSVPVVLNMKFRLLTMVAQKLRGSDRSSEKIHTLHVIYDFYLWRLNLFF